MGLTVRSAVEGGDTHRPYLDAAVWASASELRSISTFRGYVRVVCRLGAGLRLKERDRGLNVVEPSWRGDGRPVKDVLTGVRRNRRRKPQWPIQRLRIAPAPTGHSRARRRVRQLDGWGGGSLDGGRWDALPCENCGKQRPAKRTPRRCSPPGTGFVEGSSPGCLRTPQQSRPHSWSSAGATTRSPRDGRRPFSSKTSRVLPARRAALGAARRGPRELGRDLEARRRACKPGRTGAAAPSYAGSGSAPTPESRSSPRCGHRPRQATAWRRSRGRARLPIDTWRSPRRHRRGRTDDLRRLVDDSVEGPAVPPRADAAHQILEIAVSAPTVRRVRSQ